MASLIIKRRKVDFFIIGVQKGGTTALDFYLRGHPQIQMARQKEVHHFDSEEPARLFRSHRRLHDQYDWSQQAVVRGEATPIYIYWPGCIEAIKKYNPSAKIIVLLRHPAFRAHSHWRMETARGAETLSFADAIRVPGRSRVNGQPHRIFSYVERGEYAAQVSRLLRMFPREQICFERTDHLWIDGEGTVGRICRFLSVEPVALPPRRYIAPLQLGSSEGPSEGDRDFLNAIFSGEIRDAARMAQIELTHWLSPDYAEPMTGHAELTNR